MESILTQPDQHTVAGLWSQADRLAILIIASSRGAHERNRRELFSASSTGPARWLRIGP